MYRLVDGVAMSPPLAPTLAFFFFLYFHKVWMNTQRNSHPSYSGNMLLIVLWYLRRKIIWIENPNISFTVEHEQNNKLPFLDVLITRAGNGLSIHIYRKDTYTWLGVNYFYFAPYLYKFNAMKTLLFRAYNICNSWITFGTKVNTL